MISYEIRSYKEKSSNEPILYNFADDLYSWSYKGENSLKHLDCIICSSNMLSILFQIFVSQHHYAYAPKVRKFFSDGARKMDVMLDR